MEFLLEADQIMDQAERLQTQLAQGNETVTFLFLLTGVIGFLWCFLGLKLVRLWAALLGFFMGFVLGCGAAMALNLTMTVSLVIGGVVGILLAVLSAWLYHVGVFLVVWAAGISVSLTVVRPENFLYAVLRRSRACDRRDSCPVCGTGDDGDDRTVWCDCAGRCGFIFCFT